MTFKPSQHQQAIFDFVQNDTRSAVIEAVAGSGKTTTIVQAMKLLPRGTRALFLAFNKSIATELSKRVPEGVACMTMNSLGHRALMRVLGRGVRLDANKVRNIARDVLPYDLQGAALTPVCKLVGLCKAHGVGVLASAPAMDELANLHDVYVDGNGVDLFGYTQKVLAASLAMRNVIDFDDQIYMTLALDAHPQQFDVVFVDEAQDISTAQRALIARATKGRVIAVGDSRQAIYGFRGADSSSLGQFVRRFDAVRLPLSVTYRCPTAVVELAKQYAPELTAADGAATGVVRDAAANGFEFDADDLVMCRNNAPLLGLAYSLISQGRACRVMGRDIGQGLSALLRRTKANTVGQALQRVAKWAEVEMQRAAEKEQESRMASIEDKAQCIYTLAEGMADDAPVSDLGDRISAVFAGASGVTLSSVHRAKGLEARRACILQPGLMPSKFARQEWQKEQERNLMYVAYTRAQEELVFLT